MEIRRAEHHRTGLRHTVLIFEMRRIDGLERAIPRRGELFALDHCSASSKLWRRCTSDAPSPLVRCWRAFASAATAACLLRVAAQVASCIAATHALFAGKFYSNTRGKSCTALAQRHAGEGASEPPFPRCLPRASGHHIT